MTREVENEAALRELAAEYEVVRELGRGGMAVVYLARERATGRQVAIKLIRSIYLEDEEALARFAREARTVAQLQHANIVALYGVRRLEGRRLALIMQYVPGRTLKSAIRRHGPLPLEHVARVLGDVAEALAYAHVRQIVHRDIKPENIYLDPETGRAMLSDFGIARAGDGETELTRTGMSLGTPSYMSPEQIDGRVVDGRSDLYSLGLVGYEMLTGQKPWQGETLYSVIYKQKHEQLPGIERLRSGVPPAILRLIERCLHKDPDRRWPSAEEFLAALRAATAEVAEAAASAPLAPAPPAAADDVPGASPASDAGPAAGPVASSPDMPTVRYVRPVAADAPEALPAPWRRRHRWAGLAAAAATALVAASAVMLTGMWRRAIPYELEVSPPDEIVEAVLDAAPADTEELAAGADPGAAGTTPVDTGANPAPAAGAPAPADPPPERLAAAAEPGAADSAVGTPARRPLVPMPRPRFDTELGVDDEEIQRVLEVRVLGKRHPEVRFPRERVSYLLVETRNRSTWPIHTIAGRILLRDASGELLKTLHLEDGRLLPPGGSRREVYQWSSGFIEFPRDRRIRTLPLEELEAEWVPERVVFDNGLDWAEEKQGFRGLADFLSRLIWGEGR